MNLEISELIALDKDLKNRVSSLYNEDYKHIDKLAKKCCHGNLSLLKNKDDLTSLAVVLKCLETTKTRYEKLKISEKIFIDTIDDVRIWCENNGNKGLNNLGWIKNHIDLRLFKIGRLQFQPYKCSVPLYCSQLGLKRNEKIINIHIPQGERLPSDECISSIRQAREFFDTFFPAFNYRFFFCESWLLYPQNIYFMDRNSNIIKFAELFDKIISVASPGQEYERIFGEEKENIDLYAEDTSLQRNAKKYLQNGGKFGMGIGIFSKGKFV